MLFQQNTPQDERCFRLNQLSTQIPWGVGEGTSKVTSSKTSYFSWKMLTCEATSPSPNLELQLPSSMWVKVLSVAEKNKHSYSCSGWIKCLSSKNSAVQPPHWEFGFLSKSLKMMIIRITITTITITIFITGISLTLYWWYTVRSCSKYFYSNKKIL